MEKIIVRGGNRLEGTVKVEGAKKRSFADFGCYTFGKRRAICIDERSDTV